MRSAASGRPAKSNGCFLVHVYSILLGLGSGVVAVIYAFTEASPDVTRVCMPIAVVSSLATFVTHLVLLCVRPGRRENRKIIRTMVNICGYIITMLLTCVGTFAYHNNKSMFFLCGLFSAVCYLLATVAFTINLYRQNKKKRRFNHNQGRNNRRRAGQPRYDISPSIDLAMLSFDVPLMYPLSPSEQLTRDIIISSMCSSGSDSGNTHVEMDANLRQSVLDFTNNNRTRADYALSLNQLSLLGVPSSVVLPSYEEARTNTDAPPKYSEFTEDVGGIEPGAQSVGQLAVDEIVDQGDPVTGQRPEHLDSPPDYDSVL